MDLKSKITSANTAIAFISRHDDVDAAVRHAALDELHKTIEAERKAMDARVQAKVAAFATNAG